MRRFLAAAALGLGLLSAGAALDGAGAAPFRHEGPGVTLAHGDHWPHSAPPPRPHWPRYAPPPRHHHWRHYAPPPRHYGWQQHQGWQPRHHHHPQYYGWR